MALNAPLYGMVLTGGQSSRMGQEKALLIYHQVPQGLFCHQLLSNFCERVFLSGRAEQLENPDFVARLGKLPYILDSYPNLGPWAGVTSAMETHPHAAWLILACDMPGVNPEIISRLVSNRNPQKRATAFACKTGEGDSFFEPLCAIYEPACLKAFQAGLSKNSVSLQRLLIQLKVASQLAEVHLSPRLADHLSSVNTPEEAIRFRGKSSSNFDL